MRLLWGVPLASCLERCAVDLKELSGFLSNVTEVTMDLGRLDYASKLIVIYVPAV